MGKIGRSNKYLWLIVQFEGPKPDLHFKGDQLKVYIQPMNIQRVCEHVRSANKLLNSAQLL